MASVAQYLKLLNKVDETRYRFSAQVKAFTWIEYRLLCAVENEPRLRLLDLAGERWVYAQGVGRLARDLQSRGLVSIKYDPADARARNIEITPEGNKALNRAHRVLAKMV